MELKKNRNNQKIGAIDWLYQWKNCRNKCFLCYEINSNHHAQNQPHSALEM